MNVLKTMTAVQVSALDRLLLDLEAELAESGLWTVEECPPNWYLDDERAQVLVVHEGPNVELKSRYAWDAETESWVPPSENIKHHRRTW